MNTRSLKIQNSHAFISKWNATRWPDFSSEELACRHCGETYHWPEFIDRLQAVRDDVARPVHVLSGHRCSLHNARVGGAPLSQHLKLAVDIRLLGHAPGELLDASRKAGFRGFGFYQTFLHVDLGHPRHWFGSNKARQLWQIYLD